MGKPALIDIGANRRLYLGLQPHTHLEEYAFGQNILKKGYNPMSLMPWTAKKLLWNPEPLGSFFGAVCLQAWRQNPNDFGRVVMNILEARLGCADLEEALTAKMENSSKKELVTV